MPGLQAPSGERALDDAVWFCQRIASRHDANPFYESLMCTLVADCASAGRVDLLTSLGYDIDKGGVWALSTKDAPSRHRLIWRRIIKGAVRGCRLDIVRRCVKHVDCFQARAVGIAIERGHLDIAHLLCVHACTRSDTDIWYAPSQRSVSALYWALAQRRWDAVEILVGDEVKNSTPQSLVLSEVKRMVRVAVRDALVDGAIAIVRWLHRHYPSDVESVLRRERAPHDSIP